MPKAPVNPSCPATALVRPAVQAMAGYVPGEQSPRAIKFNTNESPWPPAPGVFQVLASIDPNALRRYPDPTASALRRAAARVYRVAADRILVGNGSDDCLTIIYRSLLRPGDRVVVPHPTYGLYQTLAALQEAQLVTVPFAADWGLPDLTAARPRLILIANPNNPSGTLIPRAQLAALARATEAVVVVDEAYVDFAGAGASLLPELESLPNLIVLRTFSKSYGLAGARLGLLFAHPDLISLFNKVKDSYNVNALSQAMGIAALRDRAYFRRTVADTLAGRRQLEEGVKALGWTWPPSAANFLLCRVGTRAGEIMRAVAQRGLLVRWWDTPQLRHDLRINTGTPQENCRLLAALRALA